MILNTKIKDLKDNQQAIYIMLDELAVKVGYQSLNNYLDNENKWDYTVYEVVYHFMCRNQIIR